MHFNRLRLSGFKSFVDAVELVIEPGLTGIVGPNGCGKSNLIEGLRWAMGETSAKKMRGSGMDDVIFNGTDDRPARNIAEAALRLDNADRGAPAPYNDGDEIEIVRRIERESGSAYRINGADVRARDVQRLFADLATGAHAAALVGQGEIGSVVNTKPEQRRSLLEEAAGVTGLRSRRHEAELRLRAAEANLERLDDAMQGMDLQLRGLKRQARQATRYRTLSGHVRKAQAMLLYLRWRAAEDDWTGARRRLDEAGARAAERTREAARASSAEAGRAEALPSLRRDEAERAARIHRLTAERERLDEEERQVLALAEQLRARLPQIGSDAAREEEHARDAAARLEALSREREEIEALRAERKDAVALAEERAAAAGRVLAGREGELERETERVATESARRERLEAERADVEQRLERSAARLEALRDEHRGLRAEEGDGGGAGGGSDAERDRLRASVAGARDAADAAETARSAARDEEVRARGVLRTAEAELARSRAEADALDDLLSVNEDGLWPPLIDSIAVEPGYEAALGAALGDDLSLSADGGAPAHWRGLPPLENPPPLPPGAEPLSRNVRGPDALARRLPQIGVVADQAAGDRLREELRPGQRLVTRDGALWRWDGFTVRPGASTAATVRLGQRNRLKTLRREIETRAKAVAAARTGFAAARDAEEAAAAADGGARARLRQAQEELRACEERRAAATGARVRRESRLETISEAVAALEADGETLRARLEGVAAERAALDDPGADRDALAALRAEVAGLRREAGDAAAERRRVEDEAAGRTARLRAVAEERTDWQRRLDSAASQLERLAAREAEAREALAAAEARPRALAERRAGLLEKAAAAEAARREAADVLARAETELAALSRASREAQAALAAAREERVRAEGLVSQHEQLKSDIARNMNETLDCGPDEIAAVAEVSGDRDLPGPEAVEGRLERLKRERENMGPVNLRAETEAGELSERLSEMRGEREDLEAAVARLRQGISSLDRKGRERMMTAFRTVDGHFGALFKRLFGGGEARLSLVDSDDPWKPAWRSSRVRPASGFRRCPCCPAASRP